MPTYHCCFGDCNSDSRPGRPGYDGSLKFYRFPQACLKMRDNILVWSKGDEKHHLSTCDKCKITASWMSSCRRDDEKFRSVRQITNNHRVCSKHFDEKPEKLDYTKHRPKLNNNVSVTVQKRRQRMESRQAVRHSERCDASVDVAELQEEEAMECHGTNTALEEGRNDELDEDLTISDGQIISNHVVEMKTVSTQTTWSYFDFDNQLSELKAKIKKIEHQLKLSKQSTANAQLPLVAFQKQLKKNDGMCKFYTGFTTHQLSGIEIFTRVEKINYWGSGVVCNSDDADSTDNAPAKRRTYTQAQELLLFFMRMRGGFLVDDIAYRFNLSSSFVSRIVTTWVQVLYEKFDCVRPLMFPSRETIQQYLPARFRKFKNIRVIIDCAEIRCENSSSFEQQGNCYSEYKAHTTHKFLIGCTPNGAVSFVSNLMEGSIHDREIVAKSGLINLLDEGDLVLADRGFTIRDLTDEKGAILKIPAFLKGRDQLTPQEEIETKEIAANRIIVEHVVGRLKNFRIFQRVVPQSMRPILNQAVFVCACLLNYHEPLVV